MEDAIKQGQVYVVGQFIGMVTLFVGAATAALSGWVVGLLVPDVDARDNSLLRVWRVLLLGACGYQVLEPFIKYVLFDWILFLGINRRDYGIVIDFVKAIVGAIFLPYYIAEIYAYTGL